MFHLVLWRHISIEAVTPHLPKEGSPHQNRRAGGVQNPPAGLPASEAGWGEEPEASKSYMTLSYSWLQNSLLTSELGTLFLVFFRSHDSVQKVQQGGLFWKLLGEAHDSKSGRASRSKGFVCGLGFSPYLSYSVNSLN